jgi:hypothetical protein
VYGSVSKVKKINDDRQLLPRYLTKDTERLHITYCTLYIVYSILPLAIAYSLWIMATVNCILHISYGIFHMAYFILHHIMFVAPFKAFYHVKTPYPQTKIGTDRADIADNKEIY